MLSFQNAIGRKFLLETIKHRRYIMLKFGFGLVTGVLLTVAEATILEAVKRQRSKFEEFLEDDIDIKLEKLNTKLQEVKEQHNELAAEQLALAQS